MARIGQKNTSPEMAVRKVLYSLGYRYRLHAKGLPGTPDIIFKSKKKAIFVHGCFWHGHFGRCRIAHIPKSNTSYWQSKIERNRARDSVKLQQLISLGWEILVIWECEVDRPDLEDRLIEFLTR